MNMTLKSSIFAGAALLSAFSVGVAQAQCGLCAKEIVTNSQLATCFLQEFPDLAKGESPAVAVDLSDCGGSRGVVEALPSPDGGTIEPSVTFMVSRTQLACLKDKLEDPDITLDPSAKIELAGCE